MGSHGEREKHRWPRINSKNKQMAVALPTELQVQIRAGRVKLKLNLAADELYISERVTSKVWPPLNTSKHI